MKKRDLISFLLLPFLLNAKFSTIAADIFRDEFSFCDLFHLRGNSEVRGMNVREVKNVKIKLTQMACKF